MVLCFIRTRFLLPVNKSIRPQPPFLTAVFTDFGWRSTYRHDRRTSAAPERFEDVRRILRHRGRYDAEDDPAPFLLVNAEFAPVRFYTADNRLVSDPNSPVCWCSDERL